MNAFTYTHRFSARLLAVLAVFSLLVSLVPLQAFSQEVPPDTDNSENPELLMRNAAAKPPTPKIDICHATNSNTNPYNLIDADETADVGGHAGHHAGAPDNVTWFNGINTKWGDIIPPFTNGDINFPGKNWTTEGQAIWNNDCVAPGEGDVQYSAVKLCKIGATGKGVKNFELTLSNGQTTYGNSQKTGNNGCFEVEAPYGTYTFDEVMPNNKWVNILNATGTAAGAQLRGTEVVVNGETEKFTLQNMQCEKGFVNSGRNECVPEPRYADVTLCKVGGTGVPLTGWELFLKQGDDSFKNGLTAKANAEAPACLSISHVLYGTYTIDETMKSEFWDNVATTTFGVNATKGAQVVIDSETEKFTLMNREVEHCDDASALNYNKRGKCEYPGEGKEVITACKYLPAVGEDPRESVAGWGMLFVNAEDPDSEGAMALYGTTTENGCVSKEVDPEDGPWFVFEQNRAGWAQVDVETAGGTVWGVEGNEFCKFFAPTILDRALSFVPFVNEVVNDSNYRCDFYNEELPVVLGCTDPAAQNYNPKATPGNPDAQKCTYQCTNLLQNGSFETPLAPNNSWSIFNNVPNWVISLSDGLEIWRNFNGSGAGLASDGAQNVEMDGNDATKITQSVATVAGATYELKFDFSPRAGTGLVENNVDAAANGNLVVNVTGDGSANSANVWTTHGGTFVAAGTSTAISFEDKGAANDNGGLGALIDNARLCKVKDPEPPAPACKVNVFSDVTNTVTQKGNLNAIVVTNQPVPPWVASITGSLAQWIWGNPASGSSIDPVNNETQTFVKTFVWNGPVTSGKLKLSADNFYTVTLNGTTVAATTTEFNYNVTKEFDIASLVQQGTNTLEIAVTNMANGATAFDSNPAGLLYDLTVVGNNTTDCTQTPGGGGDNDELSCSLTASDTSVRRGNGVTLNWMTNNAVSANVTTLGDLASTSLPNGSGEIAEINSDTTFVMTVMDDSEKEATCSVTVNTTGGGGGGGGGRRNNDDGEVAGDSSSRPKGQVLGEQVSVVPLGAADAGAGGTAPVALPSFGLTVVALLGRTRR